MRRLPRIAALSGTAGALALIAYGCGQRAEAAAEPAARPATTTQRSRVAPPTPASAAAPSSTQDVVGAPPEIARPYDEAADAAVAIDAALVAARVDGKSVLLVFGANWCPWCRRLEHTLTQNREVAAELARGFHVVHVDTGARGAGKNAAVAARYGEPTRLGLPVLVVLGPHGDLRTTQETGALEAGDRHDPAAILAFFARVRR